MSEKLILCCSPETKSIYSSFIDELSIKFNLKEFRDLEDKTPIVLLGGDGSLNYMINELNKKSSLTNKNPVLYFPTGTANDFAKSLGINETEPTVQKVQDILNKNSTLDIPLMKCNDKLFINVLTAGAPAKVTVSGTNMLKELTGKFSYYLQAIEEVLLPSVYDVTYKVNDQDQKIIKTYGFTISQGLYAGGGVKVSKSYSAHFSDTFEFIIPKTQSMSSILSGIIELQKENPNLTEIDLDINNCEKLFIETQKNIEIKLDGEEYKSNTLDISKTSYSLPFYSH